VAWIKADVAKTLTKDECCYAFGSQNPKGTLIPLYAEQPAPVAVDDNVEFDKWWMSTPILRKQKIQIAQEAWFERANLSK
jgi:hypothetical protein